MLNRIPKHTIRKSTPSLEDMINQGNIANQNIPLPTQTNTMQPVTEINSPPTLQNASMYMLPEENKSNSDYSFLNDLVSPKTNQTPITQPTINEDEDTGGKGIGIGQALAQSLAMLGAGVRGGDVGQVGRMFDLNRQEAFRQGQYQKQKAEQKQKIKEQENTARQYVDPNSEISIQERAKAKELYPFEIPKNLSYADINNNKVMEALKAKYNATQEQKSLEEQKGLQSRLDDPNSEESKRLMESLIKLRINVPKGLSYNEMEKYYGRLVELSKPQPMIGGGVRGGVGQAKPEKKKKLGVEEAKTLFNISTAYNAIQDLKDAVKKNVNKYSLIGDNEYTESANRFKEGIGRLLSGGAIGDEEGKNFLNLIPTIRDSDETAKRKLEKMDQDLTFKYKTLGYNKEDVLYDKSNEIDFNKE